MVGYIPAELLARWNSNSRKSDTSNSNVPLKAKFISSPKVLMLDCDSSESIEDQVNEFVYTGIFLGKSSGEITCSAHNEKCHFLARKTLINNPFIEKYSEMKSQAVIDFKIEFKIKRRR